MSEAGLVVGAIMAVGIGAAVVNSAYVIDEGRVGVITNMGRAVKQETPAGLQFKTPFVMGVKEFDVRERALPLALNSATSNQLETNMEITVNWRPDPARIMEIFVQYGSPEEFASNVMRPRLNQSTKAVVGKFTSLQLTTQRAEVADAMLTEATRILSIYPVLISSVQVDNFTLPERYWNKVLDREEQREIAEREKLVLEQQDLQAQQEVQSANAARDAAKAIADGEAYKRRELAKADADAIRLRGQAEAEAIEAQARALGGNPLLIELRRAETWDGKLPVTVMGDQPSLLMQMPSTVVDLK